MLAFCYFYMAMCFLSFIGDMAPKYRNLLVNSFLCAAKHSNPVIRCSAVSNLGELCGKLGYSFVPITQEVKAVCVCFPLKTHWFQAFKLAAFVLLDP